MNVTKVESVTPFTAVTPSLPLSGEAKGPRGSVALAPNSSQGKVATGELPTAALVAMGAKHGLPLERASRERDVQEAVQKANEALKTLGRTSLKPGVTYER
jgi:hypothetical protein